MINFPFQNWFRTDLLVGGDWRFFWPENLREILSYSFAWDSSLNTGIGRTNIFILWLNSYLALGAHFFTQVLQIPWSIAEKLLFFLPILFLSVFSAFFLSRIVIPNKYFNFFSGFLYCVNTYTLMIFGGGQVGVALAYSLAPLVLAKFIQLINSLRFPDQNISRSLVVGFILAIQMMFDPRVAYTTLLVVVIYFFFHLSFRNFFFVFVIPGALAVLFHFFWIFPLLTSRQTSIEQLGLAYFSKEMVKFLSFADFSHSFSLLHPNWPENIFGKTYFMRPEFLGLPILAYLSLLFLYNLKSQVKIQISFFALLGLLGAFLAKGTNPPLGEIYLFLLNNLPGFNLFRDPTKWYTLVALSYSILIPFSVFHTYNWLKKKLKVKKYLSSLFLILTASYLLLLIKPAILGELGGTFKPRPVPEEYVKLKDLLASQPEFFRTLWIPQRQRFGFSSNLHPAISGQELLKEISATEMVAELQDLSLSEISVKYVIIPFDSESEIFLKDRKYDHKQRLALEEELDEVSWLKKIDVADKIAVYETSSYKDHFFIDLLSSSRVNDLPAGEAGLTSWRMINPTKYIVSLKINQPPTKLIFSETYDELWQAKIGEKTIPSTMINDLNSFAVDQTGDFDIVVEFAAQRYVYYGLVVSAATLLAVFGALAYLWRKR